MQSQSRTSNLSWPDVVFLAEAEREPFAEVQIITLYAHCLNIAEAMLYGPFAFLGDNPVELRKKLEKRIKDTLPEIQEREFVEIQEDRVLIVIDADKVDDDAVARALDLLTHIDNFEVGQTYHFGEPRSFTYRGLH